MVVMGAGRGHGEPARHGHRASVWEEGTSPGTGDGTTLWTYLTSLKCVLRNGYDGKFYVLCV